MNAAQKKLFVKCWEAEYQATVKVHALQDKIDAATRYELPTARLENSLTVWSKKQGEACDPLIELIKNGSIGKDATDLCSDLLGYLSGYTADCYYELWLDYKPKNAQTN